MRFFRSSRDTAAAEQRRCVVFVAPPCVVPPSQVHTADQHRHNSASQCVPPAYKPSSSNSSAKKNCGDGVGSKACRENDDDYDEGDDEDDNNACHAGSYALLLPVVDTSAHGSVSLPAPRSRTHVHVHAHAHRGRRNSGLCSRLMGCFCRLTLCSVLTTALIIIFAVVIGFAISALIMPVNLQSLSLPSKIDHYAGITEEFIKSGNLPVVADLRFQPGPFMPFKIDSLIIKFNVYVNGDLEGEKIYVGYSSGPIKERPPKNVFEAQNHHGRFAEGNFVLMLQPVHILTLAKNLISECTANGYFTLITESNVSGFFGIKFPFALVSRTDVVQISCV